jgi:hypothetical protein
VESLGITHSHPAADEIATGARERYIPERWHGLTGARYTSTTDDPLTAWRWITERRISALEATSDPAAWSTRAGMGSADDWGLRSEVTWWMLTHAGRPAGGGLAISDGRSVDIVAEPMTARSCEKQH